MRPPSLLKAGIAFVLGTLLLANYTAAYTLHQSSVTSHRSRLPDDTQDKLPSAATLRGLSLGFETLAADLAWIWSLVYHGKHLRDSVRPAYLKHGAETVADLDPKFYDVYQWFSATYIRAKHPPSYNDLQTVNAFLERGMEEFPTDYKLPYEAGLNYIGYSTERSDKIRLKEYTHGIEYLQRAARLEGAPDDLLLTVSWMYERRRQLRRKLAGRSDEASSGKPSPKQVEFLAEMYYLIDDQSVRRAIEHKLSDSPRGQRLIARYQQRYKRKRREYRTRYFAYLPLPLWISTASHSP